MAKFAALITVGIVVLGIYLFATGQIHNTLVTDVLSTLQTACQAVCH